MASSGLKLYAAYPAFVKGKPIRARHFRPQWALNEMNVDHEIINVDLMGGEKNPTNPLGEIPSLVDGDFTLTESCAITIYLAKKYANGAGIYPFKTLQEESRVQQFALFSATTLETNIFKALFNDTKFSPFPDRANEKEKENGITAWNNKIKPYLTSLVKDKAFIHGDSFTVLDILLAFPLQFAAVCGLMNEKDTPEIAAWFKRCSSRPAYEKSMAFWPKPIIYGLHFDQTPPEDRTGRPRSTRLLWACVELDIPVRWKNIDLSKGENRKPEYLAVNPTGEIPTFVDGSNVMTESVAVANHLAERNNKFWPSTAPQKTRLQMISYFIASTAEQAITGMFANSEHFPLPVPKSEEAFKKHEAAWNNKVAPTLTRWLGDNKYFLGDEFTILDLNAGYALNFCKFMGQLDKHPELTAYWKRVCDDRPAFHKAWQGPKACGAEILA